MYKPKDSMRWQPKVAFPLRLDDQCVNVAYDMLTKTAEKLASGRNSRGKKAIREYISTNVPVVLQKRIMQRALAKLVGVHTTLNLLDIFEPTQMSVESVDLLGNFRFVFKISYKLRQLLNFPYYSSTMHSLTKLNSLGFGCYFKEGRLTWSQGSAKKFNLTAPQLEQLYNILLWARPSELQELTVSIARESIKLSKIPSILAQARSLTKVTILSGAENHTLRILGMNCPCILTLDVSHSIRVTDQGLRNLLLKHRTRKGSRLSTSGPPTIVIDQSDDYETDAMCQEVNPCSKTICSIVLVGTSVTWKGCDLACKLMNFGYLTASLPFIKIVRVNKAKLCFKGLQLDRQKMLSLASPFKDKTDDTIFSSVHNTLLPEQLATSVMDVFSLGCQRPSQCTSTHSLVFLRDNAETFKINLHLKLDSAHVTSLVLPWYTFTWRLDSLVDLDTLGVHFPNLRFLKGRIKGKWNHADESLLPNLQGAYVWSLNSSTALSMLQNIPSLKFLEFNNTRTLLVHENHHELTDATLEAALNQNKSIAESLESLTIRPSELTTTSLKVLTSKCPKLKRIGDLESWDVTSSEITEFNAYLDSVRSQCILAIMNFPPLAEETYQWAF